MKAISSKTHGKLDYFIGLVLITSPWIFHYASSDQYFIWIPFALGSVIILYSMLTKYELGFFPAIGMKMHLVLDFIGGAFLAASPWIFQFNDVIYLPHLIIGILLVIAAFISDTKPHLKTVEDKTADEMTTSRQLGKDAKKGELYDIQREDKA